MKSVRIRSFSNPYFPAFRLNENLSIFGPNAGKCRREKLRIRTLFTQWSLFDAARPRSLEAWTSASGETLISTPVESAVLGWEETNASLTALVTVELLRIVLVMALNAIRDLFLLKILLFWHFHLWITKLRVFSCNLSQSVSYTNSIYASGVIVNLYPTMTQHVEIRTQKKLTILKYKTKDLWFLNATYFFASKTFIWSEENFRIFRPKIFLSHQANTLISCKILIQIEIQWCHRYLFVEKLSFS